MALTIWKFPCDLAEWISLYMPDGASILAIQQQIGTLCVWALCDPHKPPRQRRLRIFGTGHPIPSEILGISAGKLFYRDTIQDINGEVWHIFEEVA